MRKNFIIIAMLASACISMPCQAFDWLCGNEWGGDVDLTAGYRYDRILTHLHAYSPPGTLALKDNLTGKSINICEVGAKGRVFFCDNFLNGDALFAKGFATFGRVVSGRYKETIPFPTTVNSTSKGNIHRGNTQDFSLGIGYFFPIDEYLKVGPTGGYSYNFQKIKMRSIKTNGTHDAALSGLSYQMCWEGPWAGCEAEFWLNCITRLNLGYEYHWCTWHADWTLAGPDVTGGAFSDKRNSHRASGNVFYIDAICIQFCPWDIGFGIKYQTWDASKGHAKPRAGSFAAVGASPNEVDKISKATWQSLQGQLTVSYSF